LGYFPRENHITVQLSQNIDSLKLKQEKLFTNMEKSDSQKQKMGSENYQEKIDSLELLKKLSQNENSYIGRIGKIAEPVMKPLGFDWKMSVSIITGIAAKEVVVSTLGVLYQSDSDADEHSESLKTALQKHANLTPLAALSFLVFVLIYFPCIAVIAAVKKETGHWKWAFFVMGYTTFLAWVLSFLVYQVGSFFV